MGRREEAFDLAVLTERVLAELQRRLNDEKEARQITGPGLVQLAKELLRVKDQRDSDGQDDEPPPTLAEIIDQPGLPNDQKQALVEAELQRVYEERDRLLDLLRTLET